MKQLEKLLKKFLNDVHTEYVHARKTVGSSNLRIIRGRSHTISSIAEDLFAKLLYKSIKTKRIIIFVDQPISLIGKKKTKTVYPDIVICSNVDENVYKIHCMIDLKMDTNWNKNSFMKNTYKLNKNCKEMKKAKQLKGKKGDVVDEKKPRIYFEIDKNAFYDEVIINSKNTKKNEDKMLKASNSININLWVLSTGQHPNYNIKRNETKPNNDDWKVLINKIKKSLKTK